MNGELKNQIEYLTMLSDYHKDKENGIYWLHDQMKLKLDQLQLKRYTYDDRILGVLIGEILYIGDNVDFTKGVEIYIRNKFKVEKVCKNTIEAISEDGYHVKIKVSIDLQNYVGYLLKKGITLDNVKISELGSVYLGL